MVPPETLRIPPGALHWDPRCRLIAICHVTWQIEFCQEKSSCFFFPYFFWPAPFALKRLRDSGDLLYATIFFRGPKGRSLQQTPRVNRGTSFTSRTVTDLLYQILMPEVRERLSQNLSAEVEG